jgi:hypothetical protein
MTTVDFNIFDTEFMQLRKTKSVLKSVHLQMSKSLLLEDVIWYVGDQITVLISAWVKLT